MDPAGEPVEATSKSTADVLVLDKENELNNLQWIRDLVVKFKGVFGDLTIHLDDWLKHFANSKKDFTQGNQNPSLNALSFAVLVNYEIIGKFSDALMKKEHFEEAVRLGKIIVAGYKGFFRVGSPMTIQAHLKLHSYLFTMNEYAQALDLNLQVYEILKGPNFDPHHELTITVQLNVASIFMHQNKSAAARQILQDVYLKRVYLLGTEHLKTAEVRNLLKSCFLLLQKEDEAEKLLLKHFSECSSGKYTGEEGLSVSKAVAIKIASILSPDHLKTIHAKLALAASYILLHQFKNVYEISRLVYEKRKKILGRSHVDTLDAHFHTNVALFYLQEFEEALRENKILHALQVSTLGADHEDTLKTLQQIAYCFESLKKYKKAVDVQQTLLQKQQCIFGSIHYLPIKTERTIAKVLGKMGQCKEALDIHRTVYGKQVKLHGKDHSATTHTKRVIRTGQRQLAALERGEAARQPFAIGLQYLLGPNGIPGGESHDFV